ncbi:hypothetical protein EON82_14170 [bacterium]|nr:MAG: hypothetical protein EON82_14170 [bacterium]
MDIASLPKIVAAAVIGATAAATLPKLSAKDTVLLRFEWAGSMDKKYTESLVLRASIDEPTTVRQGSRTVEVQPAFSGDGNYVVRLQLKDEQESLSTSVRAESGETLMIMGRTKKDGKSVQEKLLFLTVSPI